MCSFCMHVFVRTCIKPLSDKLKLRDELGRVDWVDTAAEALAPNSRVSLFLKVVRHEVMTFEFRGGEEISILKL